MEIPKGPTVVVAIPAGLASDVASALELLAKRRWLDGDPFDPRLDRLREELAAHGRRRGRDQDFSRHSYR